MNTESTQNYAYYGGIGTYVGFPDEPVERKDVIIQSLWTKPILGSNPTKAQQKRMKDTLYIAALSLECAHRSGYKVHMHTDRLGMELLSRFGYEELLPTLEDIPSSVPTELFAAGKFFALRAEGITNKVHIDIDVFLKRPYLFDNFYMKSGIDMVCQQEENYDCVDFIKPMIRTIHIVGYPETTRPDWTGSMNTGVIGFNNPTLGSKYVRNYFNALQMYTEENFAKYRGDANKNLAFDFILEQVNVSYLSLGYNVWSLLPSDDASAVADEMGYQHLQGDEKWTARSLVKVKSNLKVMNFKLYNEAFWASKKVHS